MSAEFFSVPTSTRMVLALAAQPLASLLRSGRARLDLSQEEVARVATVSRFRLHQAERGLIELRRDELQRLAAVLELQDLRALAEARDA